MLFAIVFGLSMDYEVFLVSRIHEEWTRTPRPASGHPQRPRLDRARDHGRGDDHDLRVPRPSSSATNGCSKLFGLSLASAVFLDAFVVRSLLLPSVLQLLGRRTWTLPAGWSNACRTSRSTMTWHPRPAFEEA